MVVIIYSTTVVLCYGQQAETLRFSIDTTTGTTIELLELLQQRSGYVISYSSRLCLEEEVTLSQSENTLIGFLKDIFKDCPFTYTLKNNRIILRPKPLSEESFTISGFISDKGSGERLLGANVYNATREQGTASNYYGFYSLTLPGGPTQLSASFVGYKTSSKKFVLQRDTVINFNLSPSVELPEISILGSRIPNMLEGNSFGAMRVSMDQINDAPALFGEPDLVRGIQMLPGIQSGSEGFSGLYVRGGGPDQNLILLDDVPVYNVGHLLGFFSIFNTEAVSQVSITKEGFPARYGGRLSSVVDVRMKDGRKDRIGGDISLGLLSSGVSLDGPVLKDKSTFAVSLRRTYIDALAAIYQLGEEEKTNYYFFDLNGKINYEFSDKSKLYLSAYWGRDKFYTLYNFRDFEVGIPDLDEIQNVITINDESNAGWGNFTSALRWNYVFNKRLFSNFTATYSNYRFFIGLKRNEAEDQTLTSFEQRYLSGIEDFTLKSDFEFYSSPDYTLRFGVSGVLHRFNPGVDIVKTAIGTESNGQTTVLEDVRVTGHEYRGYIEQEFALNDRFKGNTGLHAAFFLGGSTPYWSIEPRISLRYRLLPRLDLKGAYSRMSQFIHLVGTAGFSLPTDLWLPVSDNIEPMRSQQGTLGVNIYLGRYSRYILSFEGYLKSFENILSYKESTGFFDYSTAWEDKLTSGYGESFGGEMLLQKNSGNLTGWLGYTYSHTTSYFDELNEGNSFPGRYDRRHDASIFLNYRINHQTSGSLTWMFGSGNPVTLPEEKYFAPTFPFGETPEYGYSQSVNSVNNFRMPSFHRLDVGINFTKKKERGVRTWSVGVINVYGHQNPFLLYFAENDEAPEGEASMELKQLSLFPFPIPYVKFSFKF
ncbi:TonB-dependent receptor [Thermophagus xiamenensis]|uniref:Outer membrane receptor proteins, mostly Fe transport n=1 Tax=Thermophagus xiamenensis TaxID=385682 RepID=A0A1I2BJ96_9BACT|nr:carboxypeptidase-like regulatory domain-containing protein [Thermophagus xiamenensis]SFE56264.1 Outer membrane receptor proteins, mostly Fe transport [Thermophagus xiamenensis]